jgi:hypothetical protein
MVVALFITIGCKTIAQSAQNVASSLILGIRKSLPTDRRTHSHKETHLESNLRMSGLQDPRDQEIQERIQKSCACMKCKANLEQTTEALVKKIKDLQVF